MKIFTRLLFTLSFTVVFIYMGHILLEQQTKINELDEEIAYYNRELQEENLKTENLNLTINSMNTDEYIEEVARNQLGLVKPSEIIFVDASI